MVDCVWLGLCDCLSFACHSECVSLVYGQRSMVVEAVFAYIGRVQKKRIVN